MYKSARTGAPVRSGLKIGPMSCDTYCWGFGLIEMIPTKCYIKYFQLSQFILFPQRKKYSYLGLSYALGTVIKLTDIYNGTACELNVVS